MSDAKTEILPCPFCGGAARTYFYRDYWCVLCKCEGEGPPSDHEGGAVAYWNQRAATPSAPSSSQQGEADAKEPALATLLRGLAEAIDPPQIAVSAETRALAAEVMRDTAAVLTMINASLESAKSGEVGK